jgi:hypothetical protein
MQLTPLPWREEWPSSLLSPCHVQRAHAHSCQRADNVLFWPAVTLPSRQASVSAALPVAAAPHRRQGQSPSPSLPRPIPAKVSCPPRRRRSPSPPRSVVLPVAAAPHRRQGQSPSPSPPLSVAAKVSRPPHCRSSPSPSLPLAAAQPAPSLSQEHRPSRSQEHRPLAQPAETRTRAPRQAKEVQYNFFLQNT